MKRCFLIFLFITLSCSEKPSNKFNFKGNHIAIMVNDMKETGDFYAKTLRMNELNIKSTGLAHRWFKLNDGLEIHLVSSSEKVAEKNKNNHLAIEIDNIKTITSYLKEKRIDYYDWYGNLNQVQERFDGVLQIYLEDPEGNWIEINQK